MLYTHQNLIPQRLSGLNAKESHQLSLAIEAAITELLAIKTSGRHFGIIKREMFAVTCKLQDAFLRVESARLIEQQSASKYLDIRVTSNVQGINQQSKAKRLFEGVIDFYWREKRNGN